VPSFSCSNQSPCDNGSLLTPVEVHDRGRRIQFPAGGQATPMTYRYQGRRYVVIAAGGRSGIGTAGDYVVAFALPAR
jgi:hypothetical protein